MRSDRSHHDARRGAAALALLVAIAPVGAIAQSANDYRLPQPTPTPTASARVLGPVDPDNPAQTLPRTRPTATASPLPLPVTPPAVLRTETPARPAARRAAAAPAHGRPQPTGAATTPAAAESASPPVPASSAPGPAMPTAAAATANAATGLSHGWLWLLAAFAAGAAATLAAIRLRRRAAAATSIAFEPPVLPRPSPASPAAKPPAQAAAPVAATAGALVLTLEARRLTASLVATTLSYTLTLTNRSGAALTALAIEGDLVAAHNSLPVDQQIAQPQQRLAPCHALPALAAGESIEFKGDLRLPLTAITPLRAGGAAYFVPLVRFRVEAAGETGSPVVAAQTFVVGERPESAGAALRPFRLDLGPRTYSQVGQRAVA